MWRDRGVERLQNHAIIEYDVCRGGTARDFVEPLSAISTGQNGPGWKDCIKAGDCRLFLGYRLISRTACSSFSHIPSFLWLWFRCALFPPLLNEALARALEKVSCLIHCEALPLDFHTQSQP
jgi:hypothetical protein